MQVPSIVTVALLLSACGGGRDTADPTFADAGSVDSGTFAPAPPVLISSDSTPVPGAYVGAWVSGTESKQAAYARVFRR